MEDSHLDRFARLGAPQRGDTRDRNTGRKSEDFQKFFSLHGIFLRAGLAMTSTPIGKQTLCHTEENKRSILSPLLRAATISIKPMVRTGPIRIFNVPFFTFLPNVFIFDHLGSICIVCQPLVTRSALPCRPDFVLGNQNKTGWI
jgi:hypothetical protein